MGREYFYPHFTAELKEIKQFAKEDKQGLKGKPAWLSLGLSHSAPFIAKKSSFIPEYS